MKSDAGSPVPKAQPIVFIIDDDTSIRKSLSGLIHAAGYDVEVFSNAEAFLHRERYEGVGCIILDIRMPGLSGMELQDALMKAECLLPIIFITGHGDIPISVQAMKKGAIDFFPKPFDARDLLRAVETALIKSKHMQDQHMEVTSAKKRFSRLTAREYEVLRYVISGLLNKQIAFEMDISEKTVKVHRGHMMEKVQVESLAELVRLAQKAGITPMVHTP